MTSKLKKAVALAGVLAILAPSAAFAQSSTEAYGGDNAVAGLEQNSGGGGGGNAPAASNNVGSKASSPSPSSSTATKSAEGDTLPFTGADLGVVAAAGALLVGFGFGLRRLAHPPTRA